MLNDDQDSDDEDEVHSSTTHSDLFSQATLTSVSSPPLPVGVDLTVGRRFHPENVYPDHFSLEDIEVPRGPWVYLACPRSKKKCPKCQLHDFHTDCIVVAIDGACSNNGKPEALSSVGVYCGDDNDLNVSCALDFKDHHTSQLAELEALLRALYRAIHIKLKRPFGELRTVIIKSDSEYVVRGVTEWLPKWKKNGWKNCKGLPVANAFEFQLTDGAVEKLEEDNIIVKFWLVPRKLNEMADSIAKYALKDRPEG
jgi:ribonuclease HI